MLTHALAHTTDDGIMSRRPSGFHLIRIAHGSILDVFGQPARAQIDVRGPSEAMGRLVWYSTRPV